MSTQAAHNDQPGHVIERMGDPMPSFLSEKIGRDYGAPYAGWTNDIGKATVYETQEAAEKLLAGPLAHVAPFCKVVTR